MNFLTIFAIRIDKVSPIVQAMLARDIFLKKVAKLNMHPPSMLSHIARKMPFLSRSAMNLVLMEEP